MLRKVKPVPKDLGSCSAFKPSNEEEQREAISFVKNINYDSVDTYITFWGFGRTSQSWIGSLLDASPNALIANQFHAIAKFRDEKIQRKDLFMNLAYNSYICGRYGRVQDYNYTIPGLWQGKVSEETGLKVIGDKTGALTTLLMMEEGKFPWKFEEDALMQKELYQSFVEMTGIENHKKILILRNPFNLIASQALKDKNVMLDEVIDLTLRQYQENLWAAKNIGNQDDWFIFTTEDFATNTKSTLENICTFTTVSCPPEWVTKVLKQTLRTTSETWPLIVWDRKQVEIVNEFIVDNLPQYYVPLPVSKVTRGF